MGDKNENLTPLRAARQSVGLTMVELSARAHVGLSTISVGERAGLLTPATAARLARVLKVDPGTLLGTRAAG